MGFFRKVPSLAATLVGVRLWEFWEAFRDKSFYLKLVFERLTSKFVTGSPAFRVVDP